jgi:hypothetical protein
MAGEETSRFPRAARGRALAAAGVLAFGLVALAWPGARPAVSETPMPEDDVNIIRNIRVAQPPPAPSAPAGAAVPGVPGLTVAPRLPSHLTLQGIPSSPGVVAAPGEIEIEVESSRPFPVRDALTVLRIGDREYTKSRYPDDGSLNRLIFYVPEGDFPKPPPTFGAPGVSRIAGVSAALKSQPVEVYYGSGVGEIHWDFTAPGVKR